MSNQAENKAGRVKVADVDGFSVWHSFWWSTDLLPDGEGVWDQRGFSWDKEPMIRDCKRVVSRDPESRRLVARYPLDSEALYFDAENPNGIPVEWDDEKTADMQAKLKAEREHADKLEKMIDKIREIALDNNDWHITGFIDRETKNVPQPYRGEDKLE